MAIIHEQVIAVEKIEVHDGTTHLATFLEEEKNTRFDYEKAGLFKFHILNITDNAFTLVFSFHHAITDGWSVASLITEFAQAYINNTAIHKRKLPLYGEFIQEEQNVLNSEIHQSFWNNYLFDFEPNSSNLKLNSTAKTATNKDIQFSSNYYLDAEQNKRIFQLADEYDTTVDVIFLSLYQSLLSVFFNKNDISIGIVVNNRLEKELHEIWQEFMAQREKAFFHEAKFRYIFTDKYKELEKLILN